MSAGHTSSPPALTDPWAIAVEAKGHTLRRDEDDGDLDQFVCSSDGHNGPGCVTCGDDWCWHCTPAEKVKPCDGGERKRAYEAKKRVEAAAPALLEALKLHDAWLALPQDRGGPDGPKGRALQAFLDAKRAALSLAEGEG